MNMECYVDPSIRNPGLLDVQTFFGNILFPDKIQILEFALSKAKGFFNKKLIFNKRLIPI